VAILRATPGLAARLAALDAAAGLAWTIVRTADDPDMALGIETKSGPADLVTRVDRDVERQIRTQVLKAFPDDAFTGEELGSVHAGALWQWWLDPVDGTTNFAHRLPFCSVSIAVARAGVLQAGIVLDATSGERFSATRGRGARRRGRTLSLNGHTVLAGSVVTTELQGARMWPEMAAWIERLGDAGATARIMGSSALSLAYAAAGSAAACVLAAPHPIDTAAGILLVEEAGGVVETVRRGGEFPDMLIAGSRAAVTEVRRLLEPSPGASAPRKPRSA
jgi:fructose-1,6-bisphosphatase/inositol monophosphatase family enzyme